MQYLSIKNLTRYQHYKHRNPPWIKLYREFWTDYTLLSLGPTERLLFLGLCSLASELDNKIPADPVYLTRRLGFPIASKMLAAVSTLLCLYSDSTLREQVASTELADCRQHASKKNGKTVLPEEWNLTSEFIASWQQHGINPHVEFAAFKDHARTTDRRCKDWEAALRNWNRKAITMKETRK